MTGNSGNSRGNDCDPPSGQSTSLRVGISFAMNECLGVVFCEKAVLKMVFDDRSYVGRRVHRSSICSRAKPAIKPDRSNNGGLDCHGLLGRCRVLWPTLLENR